MTEAVYTLIHFIPLPNVKKWRKKSEMAHQALGRKVVRTLFLFVNPRLTRQKMLVLSYIEEIFVEGGAKNTS